MTNLKIPANSETIRVRHFLSCRDGEHRYHSSKIETPVPSWMTIDRKDAYLVCKDFQKDGAVASEKIWGTRVNVIFVDLNFDIPSEVWDFLDFQDSPDQSVSTKVKHLFVLEHYGCNSNCSDGVRFVLGNPDCMICGKDVLCTCELCGVCYYNLEKCKC